MVSVVEGGGRVSPKAYLLLALLSLLLFLPGRARLPPVDRDEARYLQATRQMMQTGDYIDIRFQDQPRNLQPVGVYWAEAVAASPFGGADAPVWAYRLPSLIAAVAAVLLTARLGALLFGTQAGIGAALLMATCALLSFEARMAKIDASLLATVLVAQTALAKAYLGQIRGAGRWNATVFWIATGVGLLLKGPIDLIVSGTTILVLVLTERRGAWLKRLHAGWGWLIAVAIAAPWFVAIGVRTHGAFFDKAVKQNLLGKIGRGEQHHGQPPGYYALLFNLTFWPGALAAVYAIPWVWRERRASTVRFLLAWIIPTWVIYEAVGTKLPHYVLPLYPAVACLAAGAALAPGGWRAGRLATRIGAVFYGVLWLAVAAVLAVAGTALIWRYGAGLGLPAAFAGMVVFTLAVATLVFLRQGARGAAIGCVAGAALVLNASLYGYVLPSLQTLWLGPRIAAEAERLAPCRSSELVSTRFAEPSLVFLARSPVRLIGVAPAADLLSRDRACAMAVVSAKQLAAFQARAAADGLPLATRGELDGRSYSTGESLKLLFITAASAKR